VPALHTLGETLATHLASAITLNDKEERRLLVLGLGLDRKMEGVGAGEFAELVGVGLDVL
jgi:proteasome assembly chaperone 3